MRLFCLIRLFATIVLLTAVARSGWAQGNTLATPIAGVGHDYIHLLAETVDPSSGSVSVRINAPVPPGRKLTIPFSFAYDSNSVNRMQVAAASVSVLPNTIFLHQGGWSYVVPTSNFGTSTVTKVIGGKNVNCSFSSGFTFEAPDGGNHGVPLQWVSQPAGCGTSKVDAFGARYQGHLLGSTAAYYVDHDGTVFRFGSTHQDPPKGSFSALAFSIEDRNGNEISIADLNQTSGAPLGAFSVTDTLGRTAISSSGFGSSGNTVTVGGIAYTLSWGSTQWGYNLSPTSIATGGNRCSMPNAVSGTYAVVTSISLPGEPSSQQYTFSYDPTYGLINKITYPGGGYVSYTWTINSRSASGSFADFNGNAGTCQYIYDKPAISERVVSYDGVNIAEQQDFSYVTNWASSGPAWTTKQTTVTTHDLVSGQTYQTVYTYSPFGSAGGGGLPDTFDSQIPLEQTIVYKDTNGSVLRTVAKSWISQYQQASEQTTLDNGLTSQVTYTYYFGPSNELKEKDEYDFGQSSPSRKTITNYKSFAVTPAYPYTASILDRPSSVITYNGTGTEIAETDYAYDQVAAVSASATQHDETNYSTSSSPARGNLTTLTKVCLSSCPSAAATFTYDETGQVMSSSDQNQNLIRYAYTDSYVAGFGTPSGNTNAYLTSITRPSANNVNHISTFSYAFSDGQLAQSVDENQQTSSYSYNDPLRRLTGENYPDGGQVTIGYQDSSPVTVTKTEKVDSSRNRVTTSILDGAGHIVQIQLNDPGCGGGSSHTDMKYDGSGQLYSQSNPYCSSSDPTYGITVFSHDPIGRQTKILHPDSTFATITYSGRAALFSDEGNGYSAVQRITQTDGLGRLLYTCEISSKALPVGPSGSTAPASCGLDAAGTGFLASYGYDLLGNLTAVSQQGSSNPRSFVYDSLSRMTQAANPESGTISYFYTNSSGGLCGGDPTSPCRRTDARGITTTYSYDSLNRLTMKSYSDGSTPTVMFGYDQNHITINTTAFNIANSIGRLSWEATVNPSSVPTTMSTFSYDPIGRIGELWSCQNVSCSASILWVSYGYDLLGDEIDRNLSGSDYNASYDTVGRLTTFTKTNFTDANHPTNRLTNGTYDAFGHLVSANLGNGLAESWAYDKRGRLTAYATGLTCAAGTCSTTKYGFGINYTPNGNVQSASDSANGIWSYTYDDFNRLLTSSCTSNCPNGTSAEGFNYVYDLFGNRWQQNLTAGSGPAPQFTFSNNRLVGYNYDASGNLLGDGVHTYAYDAENRIVSVDNGAFGYFYDAEGRRLEKSTNGVRSEDYFYGRDGNVMIQTNVPTFVESYVDGRHLMTEVLNSAHTATNLYFDHADWLGTERARTDMTGTACETIASLPFGDGQVNNGTCGDVSQRHFTGKERDSESGLDNFVKRYFGSSMGRFMSPDEFWKDGHVSEPQSWNEYTYGRNNPLRYVDPSGEKATISTNCGGSYMFLLCQVNVSATIAIYAAPGSNLTTAQLTQAAAQIQNEIQTAWSGSFQQDGVTYNVTTQVTVQVADSQAAAMNSGAQNVIGLTWGNASADASSLVNYRSVIDKLTGGGPDTGLWNYLAIMSPMPSSEAAHEFGHLLGVGDRTTGDVLMNTNLSHVIGKTLLDATRQDFSWAFGSIGSQAAVNSSGVFVPVNPSSLGGGPTAGTVTVVAPGPYRWWAK